MGTGESEWGFGYPFNGFGLGFGLDNFSILVLGWAGLDLDYNRVGWVVGGLWVWVSDSSGNGGKTGNMADSVRG